LHIAGIGAVTGYASYEMDFRESQMWSFSRPGTRCGSTTKDMVSAVILRPFRRRPTERFPIFTAKTIRRLSSSTIFPRGKDHQLETPVMLPVSLRRNVLPLSRF
jgi:hypothetical protein